MPPPPTPSVAAVMPMPISEATAVRLFNSVVATAQDGTIPIVPPVPPVSSDGESAASLHSANEFGNSCRICRWNRSDMQILRCPCQCKGTVGFIHLQCLKRWIFHRRDSRCEICNTQFDIPEEKLNIGRMLRSFFSTRCCGAIAKHLLFSASLLPLAHIVLQQVLLFMENINRNAYDQLSTKEVLLASCALLTSSALFFHFFEFVTTRFLLIRNILRQWWMFGNSSDYALIDFESEIFELV